MKKKLLDKKAIRNVKCDVFVIVAGKDTAVNPRHQKKFIRKMGCKYKIFKDAKHSLYTLPDNELCGYVDAVMAFYGK